MFRVGASLLLMEVKGRARWLLRAERKVDKLAVADSFD